MIIVYKEENPPENAFYKLFLTTGWNKAYHFSIAEVYRAISRSWYSISAYDGGELVGYGRMLSDGIFHAFIVEMIVDPVYQNMGIGSHILKLMVDKCKQHRIRDIQLFCAQGKMGFYRKHGFKRRQADAPGMEIKLKISD